MTTKHTKVKLPTLHSHIRRLYFNQFGYRVAMKFSSKLECRAAHQAIAAIAGDCNYRTRTVQLSAKRNRISYLTVYLAEQQVYDRVMDSYCNCIFEHNTPYSEQQILDFKNNPTHVYRKSLFYKKYQYCVRFKRSLMSAQDAVSMGLPEPGHSYFYSHNFYSGGHSYHWYVNNIRDYHDESVVKWHPNYNRYKQFDHYHNQCFYTSDQSIVMQCMMSIPEHVDKVEQVVLVP